MEGHPLCPDWLSVREARDLQERLAPLVLRGRPLRKAIALVAGADVAYSQRSEKIWASVVVCTLPGLEVVAKAIRADKVRFPYVPGLLSFREGPALLKAFALLEQRPDVVLFDGQGRAHPRGMGLACHMGLCLDLPTVGCAKSRLVGEHKPLAMEKGACQWLTIHGRRVGAVLRTRAGTSPVYVSAGYRTSLEMAVELVMATCTHYRIPEPLRQAHILANRQRSAEE